MQFVLFFYNIKTRVL